MDKNSASDHLQAIRILMERSALYRRALGPVLIVSGGIGLTAAVAARFLPVGSNTGFSAYWLGVCLVASAVALVMVRQQALKEGETFWSPPTRRVTEALLPAFFVGLAAGVYHAFGDKPGTAWLLALGWIIIYGCAIHAAGFFIQSRMKRCGWLFILGGCGLLFASANRPDFRTVETAHLLMGLFFGVLHLACGTYLYLTEQQRNAS